MDAKPVIVLASSVEETRRFLGDMLTKRFGADYSLATATSADDVMQQLAAFHASGRHVALVMCASLLEGGNGVEMLSQVRDIHPHAGRVLLMRWGDRDAGKIVLHAMTLGRIDDSLFVPIGEHDETFYRRITELLEEWRQQDGAGMAVVRIFDHEHSPRGYELRDGMERNHIPYAFHSVDTEEGKKALRKWSDGENLPVVVFMEKQVLINPSNLAVARALGANAHLKSSVYDVLIVGAGPGGLATAVYASSEGLRTLVVESIALGGQAGTSSRIRNYPGFPRGISGAELVYRAYQQAWFFGTDFVFAQEATALAREGDHFAMTLSDGRIAKGRSVVLACGATYRRLGIPNVEHLEGKGVFYGAVSSEARALEGQHVFVAGGGNSAGQAAAHLARFASRVDMLVRGKALRDTMSQYLLHQLEDLPNVRVRFQTRIVDAVGQSQLEALVLHDAATGKTTIEQASGLFVYIGAQPNTGWLPGEILRDRAEFVVTGYDLPPGVLESDGTPSPYETSIPGVYAVGDIRHNSVKRVTSAVGEGAMVVSAIHGWLAHHAARQVKNELPLRQPSPPPPAPPFPISPEDLSAGPPP